METWLTYSDIERIIKVLDGSLSDIHVTEDELEEIERIVTQIYESKHQIPSIKQ